VLRSAWCGHRDRPLNAPCCLALAPHIQYGASRLHRLRSPSWTRALAAHYLRSSTVLASLTILTTTTHARRGAHCRPGRPSLARPPPGMGGWAILTARAHVSEICAVQGSAPPHTAGAPQGHFAVYFSCPALACESHRSRAQWLPWLTATNE